MPRCRQTRNRIGTMRTEIKISQIRTVGRYIFADIFGDRIVRRLIARYKDRFQNSVEPPCMNGGHFPEQFNKLIRNGKIHAVQTVLRVIVFAVRTLGTVRRVLRFQM